MKINRLIDLSMEELHGELSKFKHDIYHPSINSICDSVLNVWMNGPSSLQRSIVESNITILERMISSPHPMVKTDPDFAQKFLETLAPFKERIGPCE